MATSFTIPLLGEGITVTQKPTITAGAYSANDAVGGLLTFANVGRTSVSNGGSILTNAIIIDDAGQDAELELWAWEASQSYQEEAYEERVAASYRARGQANLY